jgi:general secretion pathway protein A
MEDITIIIDITISTGTERVTKTSNAMYEHYFNFTIKPFELVPNPDFLYLSKSHQKAITYLTYGVKERTGFMLLTGEVGAGKTTLIRYFIRGLDSNVVLSKVFNTKVKAEQLIAMINEDFGIENRSRDKVQLVKQLYDFLIEEYSKGHQPLLIIDEAQNLSPELLEEVRMLSNLETDNAKLLQILMVGQPELGRTLARDELRQVRQRISIVCHLYALSRQETEDYIVHRLTVAGNRNALKFAPEALDAIYAYSGGIPRLVNIACSFLLLTAFTEGIKDVDKGMVNDIVESLETQPDRSQNSAGLEGKHVMMSTPADQLKDIERPTNAEISRPTHPVTNMRLLLNNMNLRMRAIEKECTLMKTLDIEEIRRRMTRLEQLQEKQQRDQSFFSNERNPVK